PAGSGRSAGFPWLDARAGTGGRRVIRSGDGTKPGLRRLGWFPVGTTPLVRWLATLDPDALAEILAHRAEAHSAPVPANLVELANRLSLRGAVAALFRTLPLPALQVLEVCQALAEEHGHVDLAALASAFGLDSDDEDLAEVRHGLARLALVWPDGERLHVVDPLRHAFAHPLGLGRP